MTPLHLAAADGDVDIIRLLLDSGASCDDADNVPIALHFLTPPLQQGRLPIHFALLNGSWEAARSLIGDGRAGMTRDNVCA